MFSVVQQVGRYESRADVREADVQFLHSGQLFQRIDIGVLKPFRSRIGRGYPQSFCPGNGTDDCQLTAAMLTEVVESGICHPHESFYIGTGSIQFDVRIQFHVLVTDAGA